MSDTSVPLPPEPLERLGRRLEPDEEGRDLLTWVQRREEERRNLEHKVKKQRIDFRTVIEIAGQVNSKGLDLGRIEGYVISMLRGQFGVLHALLLRQEPPDGKQLVVTAPPRMARDGFAVDLEGPVASRLVEESRPLGRREFEAIAADVPEFSLFAENKVELLVPLLHSAAQDGKSLKGIMAVGRRISGQPYTEADRDLLSVLGDMIAISIHNAQLYHRSIVDGLTKVYSRGHFDVHLVQEIARAQRFIQREENRLGTDGEMNKFVSLVMVDIDHFKSFNDTYGHPLGDKVLQSVAAVLHDSVRSMDIVARYGGEEFALVFPETRKEDALRIAERLRMAVEAIPIQEETGDEGRITISLGVATFPSDAADMRELVSRADVALYEAKSSGRNRVVAAGGNPHGD